MKKFIMFVLLLCMFFSVSSCKEKTPDPQIAGNPQENRSSVFETADLRDSENGTVELKSRDIPGLDITKPAEITPEEKAETAAFWMDDLEAAKKKAADEDKPMLILFTGSDWCPGCIQMEREIFSKKSFRSAVSKDFVPLMFDFPRFKSLSEQTQSQNEQMHNIYGQPPFPTVYIADKNARPFTQVDYVPGGVDPYLVQLEKFRSVTAGYSSFMARADNDVSSDVEKARLIEKAIMSVNPQLHESFYRDELKRIVALDKDNEAGLKEKYGLALRMWEVIDLYKGGKAADAVDAIDVTVEELKPGGGALQEVLYLKSQIQYGMQDKDAALKSLNAAIEAEPKTGLAEQIKSEIKMYFSK